MSVAIVVAHVLDALEQAGVGSVFEKTPTGWRVKWVDGGTVVNVEGATIVDALASHGAQVLHLTPDDLSELRFQQSQPVPDPGPDVVESDEGEEPEAL
jgi:hypothetical protein